MKEYFINLNETVKKYFKVLSDEIPDFLYDYINTPAMQRIGKIGCGCGTDYTKIFQNKFFYSNLDHSIGVALIVWNFTKDKKQTLAGLFHDISTPVFKHCIDFMNGDHETQESTEELTTYMIKNSKEIMSLLYRNPRGRYVSPRRLICALRRKSAGSRPTNGFHSHSFCGFLRFSLMMPCFFSCFFY